MAPVTHIVAFKTKPEVDSQEIKNIYDRFLELKGTCKRDGKVYIESIMGGPQSSPEAFHQGMNMVFVVTFSSAEDRDYYVSKDETHAKFGEMAGGKSDGVIVLDFESGRP